MLKLFGTLRNGSSRIGSRTSVWCISNHQVVSKCSSVTTATAVDNDKIKVSEPTTPTNNAKQTKLNLIFGQLTDDSDTAKKNESKEKVMIQKLLRIADSKTINPVQATSAISTLHEWEKNGKINIKDFKNDPKYVKLCKFVERNQQEKFTNSSYNEYSIFPQRNSQDLEFHRAPESYNNVRNVSVNNAIQILSELAAKQRRIKPLLEALATNIRLSKHELSVKSVADVFYSMALLNFPDKVLMQKLCHNLEKSLHSVNQSSVIGSIATSLGMLRYRNDKILNMISEWVVKHKNILRTQDLCGLIITLGTVGFVPNNIDILMKGLVSKLTKTDMVKLSEWLDIVWSLTILNQVTPKHLESVLNAEFVDRLSDYGRISHVKPLKLLNINASAGLLMKNYSGPFLPQDSMVHNAKVIRTKSKEKFVKSITDALTNLFPSTKYFHVNSDSTTGFLLDAEFFMDDKCGPLLVDEVTENTKALRIAVVANDYHDYCIGENHVLGSVLLHFRLLEAKGYKIIDISHKVFHTNDTLLKRITYLNDRIKSVVK